MTGMRKASKRLLVLAGLSLAALLGADAEAFGFRVAAPEGQGLTPNVHAQGEQDRIGAPITMATDQIAVVPPAGAIPGLAPGSNPLLHQLDQAEDQLLLGIGPGPATFCRWGLGFGLR